MFSSCQTRAPLLMRTAVSVRWLTFVLTFGALVGLLPAATAQTCNTISGSFLAVDGSTPPTSGGSIRARPVGTPGDSCTQPVCTINGVEWGQAQVQVNYESTYEFSGGASYYFKTPFSGSVSCAVQPPNCLQCNGSFSIGLYGGSGNFSGNVYRLPEHQPVPNAGVMADPYFQHHTTADGAGHYDFTAGLAEPFRSNNWGLPVQH